MTTVTAARSRFESLSRNQRIALVVLGLFLCRGCSLSMDTSEQDNRNATATVVASHKQTQAAVPTATTRPTITPQPKLTDTPEPTAEPTDEPTATAKPILSPRPLFQAPIDTPVPAGPPTEAPPPASNDPNTDVDCKDFPDRLVAQRWWDYWSARGVHNPGRLDGNSNGKVCER